MSKRTNINQKPRATVSEIVEQDKIIRAGFEARIGAPLPMPLRLYARAREMANTSEQARYIEGRIAEFVNMFAKNGNKNKFLSQAQRDIFWREMDYAKAQLLDGEDFTPEGEEDAKWDAYCQLIGIPAASRIGNMFQMLPDDRHPPKEWSFLVVASVTSQKLLCKDLAEFMEFMVWFTGGWPDTFAGELDKRKAQRLYTQCAAESLQLQWEKIRKAKEPKRLPGPDDVKHINPVNSLVTLRTLMLDYPEKLTLTPANFTELMALSGAK